MKILDLEQEKNKASLAELGKKHNELAAIVEKFGKDLTKLAQIHDKFVSESVDVLNNLNARLTKMELENAKNDDEASKEAEK